MLLAFPAYLPEKLQNVAYESRIKYDVTLK